MDRSSNTVASIDWVMILLYALLVLLGWLNIYSAAYDETHTSIFDFSQEYGKQIIWIGAAFLLAFLIMLIDSKFFTAFSFVIYGVTIFLLIAVLFLGKEVNGSRSWFELGGVRIQPAEFAKFATTLAVANVMSRHNFKVMQWKNLLLVGLVILLPAGLIELQKDTGSALVYSSFIFVLFREGLHASILLLCFAAILLFIFSILYSPFTVLIIILICTAVVFFYYRHNLRDLSRLVISVVACFFLLYVINMGMEGAFSEYVLLLVAYAVITLVSIVLLYKKKLKKIGTILLISWLSIGFSASVDYVFDNILRSHQRDRINDLLGVETDPTGAGYNVLQSKIAIGSGGVLGKGYLQGTQTRLSFVPYQSTDFIFCTVGEEWGFVGSTVVILLFMTLMLRIINLAERQRSTFSRVYGYGVASILFFHVAVNIGMTIGLAPVIGIPLPFFSYGGSSLWSFTILIFIFLRLDANRLQVFR